MASISTYANYANKTFFPVSADENSAIGKSLIPEIPKNQQTEKGGVNAVVNTKADVTCTKDRVSVVKFG
jgi:hypothetical protein